MPFGVLAVHPPGEVQQQLVEDALEERAIARSRAASSRSGRRASAAQACTGGFTSPKRPLVGGQLAVRMHVPLAQQQHELLLGELRVDERQRHAVECEIPRRVPRVLPLVRHRDDVGVVQVRPLVVAAVLRARRAAAGCAGSPSSQSLDDVVVELLRPEQPGERLPRDACGILGQRRRDDRRVELVGLARRRVECLVEADDPWIGATPGRRSFSRRRTVRVLPGATSGRSAPPPSCPWRAGFTAPRLALDHDSRGTRP